MVEVIHIAHVDPNAASTVPGPYSLLNGKTMSPRVEIQAIERLTSGYSNVIKVYGEIKIAARECVLASELKLSTIRMILLTPENTLGNGGEWASKVYIRQKGQMDNWASIDIYDSAGVEITAGAGPDTGSVWLGFLALGE
jgi:hypothetical protein